MLASHLFFQRILTARSHHLDALYLYLPTNFDRHLLLWTFTNNRKTQTIPSYLTPHHPLRKVIRLHLVHLPAASQHLTKQTTRISLSTIAITLSTIATTLSTIATTKLPFRATINLTNLLSPTVDASHLCCLCRRLSNLVLLQVINFMPGVGTTNLHRPAFLAHLPSSHPRRHVLT